jgi:stage V sporulation protein T
MKSTGVVRRVDELGRIVIPKEIRRTLKIRDGEELEIYVENDMIFLRKFSKIFDLSEVSRKIIDVANSLINKTILICDRDYVVSASGEFKKRYLNKELSKEINSCVFNGKQVVNKSLSSIKLLGDIEDRYAYIINPIFSFGDVVGSVIILSSNSDISEFDVIISNMIAQFLGKYVED